MRRIRFAFISILVCGLWMASGASAADLDRSLDCEWDFTYTQASASDIPEMPSPDSFESKMPVPGRWDDNLDRIKATKWFPQAKFVETFGGVNYLSGVGWYRKSIEAPAAWAGRSFTLNIGWTPGSTHVWVNGKHVGKYDFGTYTPFSFDLTPQFRPGRSNELVIAVDNTRGCSGSWTYYFTAGRASGIFRPVELKVSEGPGRISDLWIKPGADLKEVVWNVELKAPAGSRKAPISKIEWQVRTKDGRSVIASGETSVPAFSNSLSFNWKQRIEKIEPWSDREPNLYRTTLRWVVKGKGWDNVDQRFGLRRWSYVGRRLYLNGEPIYIRGYFGPTWFPIDVSVPTSRDYYERLLGTAKKMGLNEVNFSHKVPPPEMLEVADELGIILMGGDEDTAYEANREHYKEVWEPIVRETRKYPSMSMYGFGGEHDYYEGSIEQFQKQHDFIKSLYPECLVVPQQAIRGIDYGFDAQGAKELTEKPFPHHAGRLKRYTNTCDLFGHYSDGAFGYTMYDRSWQDMNERFKIYDRPLVVHETYMRSSHLDPVNADKYTGRQGPWMYTRVRNELERIGLLDRWPAYAANSGKLNAIARKYCQEKVRKCNELIGYELLGILDDHFQPSFYASGIADEFLRLKAGNTLEGLRKYLGESVLLIDYAGDSLNRSYTEGEPFGADLMVSLYGQSPIAKGKLQWTLKNGQSAILIGNCDVKNVTKGAVTTLHKLNITWPQVEKTTKVNLSVRLTGSGYDILNDWDFWVFPKVVAPMVTASADRFCYSLLSPRYKSIKRLENDPTEKLRVVGRLGEEDVRFLEEGGDVILLGTEPFQKIGPIATYPGHSGSADGNVAAIINPHPIFENLPDEGWGDWHFMPLLRPAACIRFDDLDTEFDPIIEIASNPTEPRRQAAIFEKRVGKGRLFVSSCTIDIANPSCTALMDSVFKYVSGDKFHPAGELSAEELRGLLPGTAWIDDIFFGEAPATVETTGDAADREWHNKAAITDFGRKLFIKVDDGDWAERSSVSVSTEGIHKVYSKESETDQNPKVREVCVDLTSPIIRLDTDPLLGQLGGVYYATTKTLFTISATDELSGIRRLEYSLDGAEFVPYTTTFRLSKGTHRILCRATDGAGNVQDIVTGQVLTGGKTQSVLVEVKDPN